MKKELFVFGIVCFLAAGAGLATYYYSSLRVANQYRPKEVSYYQIAKVLILSSKQLDNKALFQTTPRTWP